MPVSLLQRDWEAKSAVWPTRNAGSMPQPTAGTAAVASREPSAVHLCTCALEQQRLRHHVLRKRVGPWAPLQCFHPLALLALG